MLLRDEFLYLEQFICIGWGGGILAEIETKDLLPDSVTSMQIIAAGYLQMVFHVNIKERYCNSSII